MLQRHQKKIGVNVEGIQIQVKKEKKLNSRQTTITIHLKEQEILVNEQQVIMDPHLPLRMNLPLHVLLLKEFKNGQTEGV